MNRTLHEADNAQRILKLTADTMLLVDRNGICIDIDIHSNLWFLQEERLLGKNIFERMPEDRKSTRLNSSHDRQSRMPSSA